MIITCPACATQFRVPDGALGSDGRKLRCSSCRHVWFQVPLAPPVKDPEAAEPVTQTPPQAPQPEEPAIPEAAAPEVSVALADESAPPALMEEPAGAIDEPAEETLAAQEEPVLPEESVDATVSESNPAATVAEDIPPEETESPEATVPVDETPAAPAAPVGWEPGAVMPRAGKRESGAETPRAGLRLVPQESRAEAKPETASPAQAAPAYDVTRVVTPDSAPDEKPARAPRKRRSGLVLVLLLLVALGAGAYFQRTQVMRYLPQTASLYGLVGLVGAPSSQGLQLHDVAYRLEDVGGTSSLIISGKVMNVGRDYRLLPDLKVMLLDGDMEATDTWALRTTAEGLAPGATTVFEAVYANPPRTGTDEAIFVTFADLM